MKKYFLIFFSILLYFVASSQPTPIKRIDQKADSVLRLMTLDEKIGQLNQLSANFATGSINNKTAMEEHNTGKLLGEETVQLYIQDKSADVSRPVKELKGFQKISLKPGESKVVTFKLTVDDLKYWNSELKYKADSGEFMVFIGTIRLK